MAANVNFGEGPAVNPAMHAALKGAELAMDRAALIKEILETHCHCPAPRECPPFSLIAYLTPTDWSDTLLNIGTLTLVLSLAFCIYSLYQCLCGPRRR